MPSIERICKITGEKFQVSELEQNLRKKFGVELPDVSPKERLRHIMTFHNPRDLYAVTCDLCKKPILSMWGEKPEFPVYCNPCYNSDNYTPPQMDLDLEKPFFDQFKELEKKSPHPARSIVEPMENSDYCNACTGLKNCYYSFEIGLSEDCYYCHRLQNTKGCVDCSLILIGENLYGCIACDDSYQVRWSEFARNCTDSFFLYDCVDCSNCAFSTGLRHASYVYKNEQLTKEAYEKKISELNTGSYSRLQEYLKEFETIKAAYPKKYQFGANNENGTGNIIYNSKDVEDAYDGRELENSAHTVAVWNSKDFLDVDNYGYNSELVYSSAAVGDSANNIRWSADCFNAITNLNYCHFITTSHDCFGSAFNKKLEYCILNKPYTKEEYEKTIALLEEKMKQRGEWGQMFNVDNVPFPYNSSGADFNMPLTREQAEKLGYRWAEKKEPIVPQEKVITPVDDIKNIEWKDVEGKFVICEETGKPFKIVKQELEFYKKYSIPLPRLHPSTRIRKRYPKGIFFNLHEATCSHCNKKVITSMPPEDKLLCDECYREKVI